MRLLPAQSHVCRPRRAISTPRSHRPRAAGVSSEGKISPVDVGRVRVICPRLVRGPDPYWVRRLKPRPQAPASGSNSHHALWSPDGKELFYIPGGGQLQLVAVSLKTEPSFALAKAVPVPRRFTELSGPANVRNYEITRDRKFVGLVVATEQVPSGTLATPEIRIVLNWFEELKQRIPVP